MEQCGGGQIHKVGAHVTFRPGGDADDGGDRHARGDVAIDEMGVAAIIDPATIKEIGRVAKQGLEARDWPASPPMIKIIGICEPRIAWANTRMATFFLATLSLGVVM